MKIALITDQHFGARNDSIQFHEYFSKFYKEFFFPFLEKENITTIVELGDIFDRRKYINYDSLTRCKRYWFDEIRSRNIELHCIVGNHDIYFKNTNRINSPDLLLNEYELNVYDEPTVCQFDNLNVLMMPWINNSNYEEAMHYIENSGCKVLMGHLELKGFEMYRGAINDHGLSQSLFSKYDMVMSGHFHHKSSHNNIHYLGAPYEMTWSDYNDARGFHIFDTETLQLTHIVNPYIMFNKIFYDDSQEYNEDLSCIKDTYVKLIVQQKKNPYAFDLFVDKLNSYEPANLQVVEDNFNLNLEDDTEIINEAEDTVTIIKNYLGNLNLENSKPVEDLFYELYHDAIAVE